MLTDTDRQAIVRSIAQRVIAAERMNQWAYYAAPARRARFIRDLATAAVGQVDWPRDASYAPGSDVALSVAQSTIEAMDALIANHNAGMAGDALAAERAVGMRLAFAELATVGL